VVLRAASRTSVALEQSLVRLQPLGPWAAPAGAAYGQDGVPRGSAAQKTSAPRSSRSSASGSGKREAPRAGGAAPAAVEPAASKGAARQEPLVTRIGVIADNHGYLDPAVLEIFAGVTHIIHAGDIVDPEILARLGAVAPVTAVSGNMDSGDLAALPREVAGEVGGVRFVVAHKRKRLLKDLAAGKIEGLGKGAPDLVVYGHDHVPAAAWVEGTLYLDPGSASAPHEEDDGPTVAIVEVKPAGLAVYFVPLEHRDVEELKARPKA
jgi:uncharacterized protein